jgi:hypothetical protein
MGMSNKPLESGDKREAAQEDESWRFWGKIKRNNLSIIIIVESITKACEWYSLTRLKGRDIDGHP